MIATKEVYMFDELYKDAIEAIVAIKKVSTYKGEKELTFVVLLALKMEIENMIESLA